MASNMHKKSLSCNKTEQHSCEGEENTVGVVVGAAEVGDAVGEAVVGDEVGQSEPSSVPNVGDEQLKTPQTEIPAGISPHNPAFLQA
eukprot:CAMPEP_0114244752 /NCGR_PEP_ID=MMETSP0058-20121206/11513_1 /TAXON_ID=36894 /ORGANISM="Pyramimonas parkeae, CCMP726" /LENGTH=86 /DNA_ID=CAMNT_0001357725 /DNA_START=199 /DNA_END=459 /DNA_ORIENTATION=+